MTATPPPSIFNVPELVGLVAQYLSSHDIAQCMTTCKAWTPFFKPYLWRDIKLHSSYPAPQALALNRHRIRSLNVASNDSANLPTLAADLPDTPFCEPSQEPLDSTSSSTATGNNVFQNLRILHIDCGSWDNASDLNSLCLDYILRILHQSPGLLQLTPPDDILCDSVTSNQTESFLYALAHKLPCIKGLDMQGGGVPPKMALKFLRACLNHPQLVNLHCDFGIEGLDSYFIFEGFHQFNAFLSSMEDDKKAKEATGKIALGSPIKSLRLPGIIEGYPPNFVCTLLRSYLPNLELFHIPEVSRDRGVSFVESLRDAVAQGCPKLQHLRCSWYDDDDENHDVINGIVEGCKQWGLKSFYCEKLKEDLGYGESRCIMRTLLINHSNTLEEVELVQCQEINPFDLVVLFSCRILKKVKIQKSSDGDAAIELQDVKFKCHDLKELQLSIVQPEMDNERDYFSEEAEDEHEDLLPGGRHGRFGRWMKRKAKKAYTQIGSLSKLESLSLGCEEMDYRGFRVLGHERDFTLEHGWLRELAGLKELKCLHMITDFWSEMASMDPTNPTTATTPSSSIFNVPELVGLVAQYLSNHDIAQCMTTSKAWTPLFGPYLWRDIKLDSYHPAPQALALNRHRIRSLRIAINDFANLHTLAADIGNTPFSEPSQEPREWTNSSTATGNNIFQNLRVIRIDYDFRRFAFSRKKMSLCLDYILRILHQSPGLLQLSPPHDILGGSVTSNQTESFLYALTHKLPYIKELDIRGDKVLPKVALKFLRVCLNHPQLVNLHCDFGIEGQSDNFSIEDFHQFNSFLNSMEDDKKAKEATGKIALGSSIQSLRFPGTIEGYPPNFVCTLLRSYLPNLELFHIPEVNRDRGVSFVESLRDAVAQGCPKLQHLRYSWYDDDEDNHIVINGIVEGCKQWGLKSFYCERLKEEVNYDDSQCVMATLLSNHSNTLEEVELVHCRQVYSHDLVDLFSCRNLRKAKIQQSSCGGAVIELQNVKFKCHDLKELQLTMAQPDMNPETDDFSEEEEEEHDDLLLGGRRERFGRWIRRKAEEAYTEIGSLSKLESLSVGCEEKDYQEPVLDHKCDLTLEHGWLQQLAGLKELKRIQMTSDFWSEMGQAEVEFMDAQWPKLEMILFNSTNLKAIVGEPHWEWLQKRRPQLTYC
ncbi:MAG: hypothetical protein J3Q66DRAFT_366271 [Benniella sp.]|nr:MAG: hypothetical protein J3Q66DRAFT_366271 [Benniella sp.]